MLRALVASLVGSTVDLVLPRVCAGCGRPGHVLCPRCAQLLARPRLAAPRRHPDGFPPTVAAGAYAGPVRPAVVAFKERGRAELAGPLGAALALAVAALRSATDPGAPVVLVPLPSSRAALRERGRDHVGELARAAVRELRRAGVPAGVGDWLGRRGRVRDSTGLDVGGRRANLAGTFTASPPARPHGLVVLVDDVVTTGATLTEAAAALARPGLPVLAAVVAATPRGVTPGVAAPGPGVFTVRSP
ncbi:ComF family protein [Klenkia brasiliensis]|uniref:Predicted amidophosphoribosyltransferases n=1 Tax=Klenkia brasiliensis TaxID=333142 RepID=A0A1G7WAA7_9ACTN|nr:ComF family protein [Klenkia brasiliensis]SDG68888.1 Predicted amidophosphoribosyltransferases [Klenkia brasiliensis]